MSKDPDHYRLRNGVQAINLISIIIGQCKSNFEAYLLGNVVKYLCRYREKGGIGDLEKAEVYLGWLKDEMLAQAIDGTEDDHE